MYTVSNPPKEGDRVKIRSLDGVTVVGTVDYVAAYWCWVRWDHGGQGAPDFDRIVPADEPWPEKEG